MYSQIIGTQQIVVTAAFLAVMILMLIILRRKGGAIRASLKAGKRITVLEDTAVSPTERLRLISVDKNEFLMLSTKGQPPTLMQIKTRKSEIISSENSPSSEPLSRIKEVPKLSKNSSKDASISDSTLYPSPAERAAFIKKFQSWRRDHALG